MTKLALENNESMNSVALKLLLSLDCIVYKWIRKYKNMGYNIAEQKRERNPTMKNEIKQKRMKRLKKKMKD